MQGLLVALIFIILLFFNVPIAISLGIASLSYCLFISDIPVSMVIQSFTVGLDSFTLLAVPFFILAGDIMMFGGISRRLINLARALLGAVSGALAVVTVLTSMVFAAISGSAPATVACIGGITIPEMVKEKYDEGFSCALAAAAGSLGPLIPPSLILIMYGIISQQSITTLFLAGIFPGILVAIALAVFSVLVSKKYKFGLKDNPELQEQLKNQPKESAGKAFKEAVLSLVVPVIILGGIYGGIFTPTESAVIACVYALIIGIFVYKEIKISDIPKIFKRSLGTVGTVMILVACATAFGRVLTMEQIPTKVAEAITSVTSNKIILLILINILLLVVGCFMETLTAIIILTPILLPVVTMVGVNPIHFGLIMGTNLVIGQCTPPVGVNLFVAARIGRIKVERMFKWLLPFLAVLLLVQQLITYIPGISLLLPNLMK